MKLEIKHIAPYLEHKLMTNQGLLVGLEWQSTKWSALVLTDSKDGKDTIHYKDLDEVKLILKPLSELKLNMNKKIKEIARKEGIHRDSVIHYIELGIVSYRTLQLLLEQHYDVFNLIDNGLAEVKG